MLRILTKLISVALVGISVIFYGCSDTPSGNGYIRVGVTAGPHVEIMEFVKQEAQKQNIFIKIIEFNDFILPNIALNDGDLELNCYQHLLFLNNQVKYRKYNLVPMGNSILLPMGLYSKKLTTLEQVPNSAKIAIPNDPTNGGRALLLIRQLGLIQLKDTQDSSPSVIDIVANIKNLKIIEIESPQIPMALSDVDLAVINTDWALLGGLDPKNALAIESTESPYANIFAARKEDKENPALLKFISIYQSPATAAFIKKRFGDAVIPAW